MNGIVTIAKKWLAGDKAASSGPVTNSFQAPQTVAPDPPRLYDDVSFSE